MIRTEHITHFAPELHIPNGTIEIDFYKKFGATENFCLRNDDGSIHVVELEINGAVFHLHETMLLLGLDSGCRTSSFFSLLFRSTAYSALWPVLTW